MSNNRVYQKIVSPIHRSTAYDFNVHLDHQSLHKKGQRLVNSPEGDVDELGVNEHEIVVRVKGADRQYKSQRLRVFSALNNLLLNDNILRDLQNDNARFWQGQQANAAAQISAQQTLEHLQAGRYPVVSNPPGGRDVLQPATEELYNIASRSLNNVLHQHLEYVGVAITPQKLFPRESRQDPQGFACTRGGLNTIHNTGNEVIHAGDQIIVDFAMPNVVNRRLLNNPSHYSTGVPHGKLLVQTRPDTHPDTDQGFVDHVLNQMRAQREPRSNGPNGTNDALVPFDGLALDNATRRDQGQPGLAAAVAGGAGNAFAAGGFERMYRPNALLMHRVDAAANIVTVNGRRFVRRCGLDVVNLTMLVQQVGMVFGGMADAGYNAGGNLRAYYNDAGGDPPGPGDGGAILAPPATPIFIHVQNREEIAAILLRLNAAVAQWQCPAFFFVEDDIGVPLEAAAPRIAVGVNFENLWVSVPAGGLGALGGEVPVQRGNLYLPPAAGAGGGAAALAAQADAASKNTILGLPLAAPPQLQAANVVPEYAIGGDNYLNLLAATGDNLTYLLEMMCNGDHGAAQVNAAGNNNNPFLSRHSPLVELVRTVVRETVIACRNRARRTIGMALSGASPGEPFDIVLSDS